MLTSEQKQIFAGHKMKMVFHMACEDHHVLNHYCDTLGITSSTVTPKIKGQFGKAETTYFLDGDTKEYKNLEEVADKLIADRDAKDELLPRRIKRTYGKSK